MAQHSYKLPEQEPEPDTLDSSPPPAEPVQTQSNAPVNAEQARVKLIAEAKKYGMDDGTGKRAFVRFARLLVQGGAAQTISGTAKGDAKTMYDAFSTGSRNAATVTTGEIVSEDRQVSETSQLSKVRAFIKLGWDYKHEAEPIFNDALKIHGQLIANPKTSDRVKLRSTYSAIYSIAVAQNKVKTKVRITPDEMIGVLLIPETEEREKVGADLLISAMVLIQNAINGRAAAENGVKPARAPVDHPSLPHLHGELIQVIGEVNPALLKEHEEEVAAALRKKQLAKDKKELAAREKKEKADKAARDAANAAAGKGVPVGASTPVTAASLADTPYQPDNDVTEDEVETEGDFEPGDFDETTERAMDEARAGE